jgi:hypothetical protein
MSTFEKDMSKYHSPKFPFTNTDIVFISLGHFRPFRFGLKSLSARMYASPYMELIYICTCTFLSVGRLVVIVLFVHYYIKCSVCENPAEETDDHKDINIPIIMVYSMSMGTVTTMNPDWLDRWYKSNSRVMPA